MEPDSPAPLTPVAWKTPSALLPEQPWRRALGLFLLAVVVVLWVTSSFLQSAVMADGEYSKPYLVTYLNTSFFALPLLPLYLRHVFRRHGPAWASTGFGGDSGNRRKYHRLDTQDSHDSLLGSRSNVSSQGSARPASPGSSRPWSDDSALSMRETMMLSAKFCGLWFLANWLNASSFSNTSVASSTILTSTSSVFTLVFGAFAGTERFSVRKLLGVLASLSGIVLISLLDTNTDKPETDRGKFPYKSPTQIAIGDGMALLSACCYGLYATILTKTIGDESRVNMPLFFGFIGAFAGLFLWPGLGILHLLGLEPFMLPPNEYIWAVLLANAAVSLVSDVCWAYAVLLTSPLVVTVGLSLTIPLSLVGQIFLNSQYTSAWYWVGALVIILSFVFINYEEKRCPSEVKESQRTPRIGMTSGDD